MKTKVILFALVIALVAGLAVPAFASHPADAWRHTSHTNSATPTPTPTSTPTPITKMGPLMIGVGTSSNNFVGLAVSILLKGDGSLKLANLKGITLDGTFRLSLVYDSTPTPGGPLDNGSILSGIVTSSGTLPKGNTVLGQFFDMGGLKPELQGNYVLTFTNFGDAANWGGLLIGNLPGIVTLLPQILTAMGGPDISFLVGTLKTLVTLINPFMPKIIVIMPGETLMKLMPLMGL